MSMCRSTSTAFTAAGTALVSPTASKSGQSVSGDAQLATNVGLERFMSEPTSGPPASSTRGNMDSMYSSTEMSSAADALWSVAWAIVVSRLCPSDLMSSAPRNVRCALHPPSLSGVRHVNPCSQFFGKYHTPSGPMMLYATGHGVPALDAADVKEVGAMYVSK